MFVESIPVNVSTVLSPAKAICTGNSSMLIAVKHATQYSNCWTWLESVSTSHSSPQTLTHKATNSTNVFHKTI